MALWQLMHLVTWCTVEHIRLFRLSGAQVHEVPQSHCGDNRRAHCFDDCIYIYIWCIIYIYIYIYIYYIYIVFTFYRYFFRYILPLLYLVFVFCVILFYYSFVLLLYGFLNCTNCVWVFNQIEKKLSWWKNNIKKTKYAVLI